MTAHDIIKRPIISERSMDNTQDKKYTFEVAKSANKIQIRKAIEEIFEVKVEKVSVMNVLGKFKRMGKTMGKRSDYKKAIVKLTEDSKTIEIFDGMI